MRAHCLGVNSAATALFVYYLSSLFAECVRVLLHTQSLVCTCRVVRERSHLVIHIEIHPHNNKITSWCVVLGREIRGVSIRVAPKRWPPRKRTVVMLTSFMNNPRLVCRRRECRIFISSLYISWIRKNVIKNNSREYLLRVNICVLRSWWRVCPEGNKDNTQYVCEKKKKISECITLTSIYNYNFQNEFNYFKLKKKFITPSNVIVDG